MTTTDKVLIISSDDTARTVETALEEIPSLTLVRSHTTDSAIEQMVAHTLAFIVMEPEKPGINAYDILAGLTRQNHPQSPPVLLVSAGAGTPDLLEAFPALLMDRIPLPPAPVLLKAKLSLFLELFRNRTAVTQSIDELEKVYTRFMEQHQAGLAETRNKKDALVLSAAFANQVSPYLKKIEASAYLLQRAPDLPGRLRQGVTRIRMARDHIARVIRHTRRSQKLNSSAPILDRPCRILYATGSNDEFQITRHFLGTQPRIDLAHADSAARAMEILASRPPDLLFIDHRLADGTGLHLLETLLKLRTDIPAVYTVDKYHTDAGAAAMATGALNFYIKEEVTGPHILAIIRETLERAGMTREIQGARDRIDVISRRDQLTRLFNRRCFDQALTTEMAKSWRYHIPLAVLLVDVDRFKFLNDTHGYETGDTLLTACAARIQGMVRTLDVVCRYGGEEFGIVLPNTGEKGARILAKRICQRIADHEFVINDRQFNLTVSIGGAAFIAGQDAAGSEEAPPDLVKLALDQLDIAVGRGGNQAAFQGDDGRVS